MTGKKSINNDSVIDRRIVQNVRPSLSRRQVRLLAAAQRADVVRSTAEKSIMLFEVVLAQKCLLLLVSPLM